MTPGKEFARLVEHEKGIRIFDAVHHFDRWCLKVDGKVWPGVHFRCGSSINSEDSVRYYVDILSAVYAQEVRKERERALEEAAVFCDKMNKPWMASEIRNLREGYRLGDDNKTMGDVCPRCNGTGKLTPSDMGACSDPDCCFQGDLECVCREDKDTPGGER